mmetsp:Transcript_12641/g.11189  ORF Transcript_12641/g.11189 Transcript_12641/m.11189 type:complete len:260 (-) Transcript_12641:519-1298(-)
MITAFQALFQFNDPIFPPSKVRFKVGFVPDKYHYTSPLFTYEDNAQDQYFSLFPDVVVGKFLKIEFYGKPKKQDTDNKNYIALQKVSLQGIHVDSVQIPTLAKETIMAISRNTINSEILKARNNGIEDDSLPEELSEEEFKFVEDSLIQLSTGQVTMIQFMEENKINDVFEWARKHREILLKSDLIIDLLDPPSKLPDTNLYYKTKSIVGLKTKRLSLTKLILCILYEEQQLVGLWDRINTELFLKLISFFFDSEHDFN